MAIFLFLSQGVWFHAKKCDDKQYNVTDMLGIEYDIGSVCMGAVSSGIRGNEVRTDVFPVVFPDNMGVMV